MLAALQRHTIAVADHCMMLGVLGLIRACLGRSRTSASASSSLEGIVGDGEAASGNEDECQPEDEEDPRTDSEAAPVSAPDDLAVDVADALEDVDDSEWREALATQQREEQKKFTLDEWKTDSKGNMKAGVRNHEGHLKGNLSTWTDRGMVTVYCRHHQCRLSMAFHKLPATEPILEWFERGETLGWGKEHQKAHKDLFPQRCG